MIRFQCPACRATLAVPPANAGKKGSCPMCGQRLQIPKPAANPTVLGELLPEKALHTGGDSMIRFKCPSCQHNLKAPDDKVGAKSFCPRCGHHFHVPPPIRNTASLTETEHSAPSAVVPFLEKVPVQEDIPEVLPVESIPEVLPASYITFTPDGQIALHAKNVPEAKIAIQELRAKKKELALAKRVNMQQQRAIRASYTDLVRKRGSKFIGGGSIGRIVRGFETISRDSARRHLANELAPLVQQRSRIEALIMAIDYAIIQLQEYVR